MADHIAIKKLTASDCTLFDAVFRTIGAGNQKSINLNADVLIDRLFPSLSSPGTTTEIEIALPMVVYGPAGKGAHTVTRKIIKNQPIRIGVSTAKRFRGQPEIHHAMTM